MDSGVPWGVVVLPSETKESTNAPTPWAGENAMLAFIAAYVDTLGFVAMFGLFTAHVTGNFVLIGAGMWGSGNGMLVKWLAFPAFIVGILAARCLDNRLIDRSSGARIASLYGMQILLLAGFSVAGLLARPILNGDGSWTIVCGMLGAAGMGVQNGYGKLGGRAMVPNTIMTGNVTQAVIDAYDLVSFAVPAHDKAVARARFARTWPPVLAFAIGAIAGAGAYVIASFWAMVVPLALLVFLMFVALRGAVASRHPDLRF
jgi:uncharacterized membrane protein YoaK (UPF0700 family)